MEFLGIPQIIPYLEKNINSIINNTVIISGDTQLGLGVGLRRSLGYSRSKKDCGPGILGIPRNS